MGKHSVQYSALYTTQERDKNNQGGKNEGPMDNYFDFQLMALGCPETS